MIWLYLVIGVVAAGSWLFTFARRRQSAERDAETRRLVAARAPEVRAAHEVAARDLGRRMQQDDDMSTLMAGLRELRTSGALADERAVLAMLDEVVAGPAMTTRAVLNLIERMGTAESVARLRDLSTRDDVDPQIRAALDQSARRIARRAGGRLALTDDPGAGALSAR